MPSHPSQQPLDDSWDLFKAVCHMSICAIAALSLVETKESPHVCIGCAEPTDSSRELMGLRDGIKAILMKQDLFTSHVFATDSEKLFAEIQTVLERLDDLICGETLSPDDSGNLPKFGKLKELRRRWEADHGAMGSNDRPALGASADSMATASSTEPDPVSCDSVSRETPSSQNASQEMGGNTSPSASTAASLLIPLIDAIHDGRLQEILQSFEMVMDATIWGDTAPQTIEYQWHASSNGQDCLSKQAHNFGLACVRLFVEPPDDVPAEVEVHLNGFQNDTLMMNTCSPKDGNNVPVQTMHKGISHPPSSLHWRGISYIMGGWNGLPCRTLSSLIGDQSFTLRLRYSTAILLVASTFLLGTGPWLANPPTLDSFLVPWPSGDVRSWCPRVHHAFGGTEDARPHCLDGDQAAALGIIILELYTNRITDWQDADVDPICLTMSHRVRLARVLTSSVDDITPDLVACARACLDFDRLVEDIGHEKSDIPVEQRKLIIVYESILQPLSYEATRQSPKLCVDLQPVLKHLHLDNMERMRKGVSVSQVCSEARFRVDCERFLGRLGGLCAMSCKASNDPIRTRNIRVAFLDSGVDKEDGMVGAAIKSKIISCKSRSFVQGDAEDGWQHDADGHGTHVARLLRHYAPTAEIFVGKICVGSKVSGKEYDGVAKAIEWAAKDCDADIISLSLGSEDDHSGIRHAIDRASQHYRKLIIASASNDGGRSGRSQPASLPGVICMHATDGDGNCGGINPSPIIGTDNFATLGIAIYSQWKEKNVLLSGTSYAVPVAVGFAVCVLEFAKHVCNIDAEDLARLTRTDAMSRVFKKMSSRRDGYDFLWPRHLWPNFKTNPKLDKESVSEEIMTILKSL